MKKSSGCKVPSTLPIPIRQQLNMYAVAAGAAGGLLALSPPAEARIVYTPAHVTIGAGKDMYLLDLNHDGIADFTLSVYYTAQSGYFDSVLRVGGSPNSVWQVGNHEANATKPGSFIGARRNFANDSVFLIAAVGGTIANRGHLHFAGLWEKSGKGVKNRYLGLKFMIHGETHFGWARLTVNGGYPVTAVLTGYAYETIPNTGIVAGREAGTNDANLEQDDPATLSPPLPQPAFLGALAIGAPGLSIWRRRDSLGASSAGN